VRIPGAGGEKGNPVPRVGGGIGVSTREGGLLKRRRAAKGRPDASKEIYSGRLAIQMGEERRIVKKKEEPKKKHGSLHIAKKKKRFHRTSSTTGVSKERKTQLRRDQTMHTRERVPSEGGGLKSDLTEEILFLRDLSGLGRRKLLGKIKNRPELGGHPGRTTQKSWGPRGP